MKKLIKPIIVTLVLGVFSYLVYGVFSKIQYKNEVEIALQTMPKFSFKTLDNTDYTNANLKLNTPTIFIYFNSECDYCQYEAESISEDLNTFKNIQIVFVSSEPIETIKEFSKRYHLNNHTNITFLHDYANTFSNRFDAQSVPYILIYDKKRQLVKRHKGQLNANSILKALNN